MATAPASNEIWMKSRFRGTKRTLETGASIGVQARRQTDDGGDYSSYSIVYVAGAGTLVGSSTSDTTGWPPPVIVGGAVYVSEAWGIERLQ